MLHTTLQTGNAALTPTLAALHGIGGVGKTQTAREYVHRHGAEYAVVVWTRADTPADFKARLSNLAPQLDASIPVQPDQDAMFQVARQWLNTHGDWLLVTDNAENLPDLNDLLPSHQNGRILLTTRERVPPNMADSIEINHLDDVTGATLLLRCAGTLKRDAELDTVDAQTQADARAVSAELGGLALALDQAGAYMHERTLTPAIYLDYYRKRRQKLHKDYKSRDHASVSVTFDLALEQVQNIPTYGPAAVELAQLCAFLAPDAIPDEVFLTDPNVLPNALKAFAQDEIAFTDVCEAATRYALLRRAPTLTMHCLAQEVVRESLSNDERKAMAERAMQAITETFPVPGFPNRSLCERLLSHSLACIHHIQEYAFRTSHAACLLNNTALYLKHRALYTDAVQFLLQALVIRRQIHDKEHPEIATVLNNLAMLYYDMGRYEEAEVNLQEASEIDRQALGENDPTYAITLDNLGQIYLHQGRYIEALAVSERAVDITRRTCGSQDYTVAIRLGNWANVHTAMNQYVQAEILMKEAETIVRLSITEDNPEYATHLVNRARLYMRWNRHDEAKPLLKQALIIYEQAHGSQHPGVASCHASLGEVNYHKGNLAIAANHLRQALEIRERTLGLQHPLTMNAREGLCRVQHELYGEGEQETGTGNVPGSEATELPSVLRTQDTEEATELPSVLRTQDTEEDGTSGRTFGAERLQDGYVPCIRPEELSHKEPRMATFNQQNQQVTNQVNVGGTPRSGPRRRR